VLQTNLRNLRNLRIALDWRKKQADSGIRTLNLGFTNLLGVR
jgi:hypothetical protein